MSSQFKSRGGLGRIAGASRNTIAGLRSTWKTEHAFRQEVAVALPGMLVALLLPVSALEKFLLIAVLLAVLLVELLNSALEAVVDRISLERHALSKHAKDAGSAAVFLSMLIAAGAWAVVLVPLML
ncbi:MAG: diacylglycerol kinase [Janthinobacterium lividum]